MIDVFCVREKPMLAIVAGCLLVGAIAGAKAVAAAPATAAELEKNFTNPPDSAKPHTWWHWMEGYLTREGITADLEAMKRVGIGGAQLFNVGGAGDAGKTGLKSVTFMTTNGGRWSSTPPEKPRALDWNSVSTTAPVGPRAAGRG